jgi:hypothetical protein
MPPLKFVCPVSGNTVETDIDIDEEGFAALERDTELSWPYCPNLTASLRFKGSSAT